MWGIGDIYGQVFEIIGTFGFSVEGIENRGGPKGRDDSGNSDPLKRRRVNVLHLSYM
jgi:hypothetical protein